MSGAIAAPGLFLPVFIILLFDRKVNGERDGNDTVFKGIFGGQAQYS
jgi:hypothetical protein